MFIEAHSGKPKKVETIQMFDQWINKMWYNHTLKYHSVKRDELLIRATIWLSIYYYAKYNKSAAKHHILHNFIYVHYICIQNRQIHKKRK